MNFEEADCAKPMAAIPEHEELQRTVAYKRKILAELREHRVQIENQLHNLTTLIEINEVAAGVLSDLADRCENIYNEHQSYLKRHEPVAMNDGPTRRY